MVNLDGTTNKGCNCLHNILKPSPSTTLNGCSSTITNIAITFRQASTLYFRGVARRLLLSPLLKVRVVWLGSLMATNGYLGHNLLRWLRSLDVPCIFGSHLNRLPQWLHVQLNLWIQEILWSGPKQQRLFSYH